jgi:DNA-directed RNA polymerase specialized sigma24 family protein
VPSEPAAWLFSVARKVVAGQVRADARRAALSTRLAMMSGRGGDGADPAEEFAERRSALSALVQLSEQDRGILEDNQPGLFAAIDALDWENTLLRTPRETAARPAPCSSCPPRRACSHTPPRRS